MSGDLRQHDRSPQPRASITAPRPHFYKSIDGDFNFKELYDQAVKEADDHAVFVEVGSWYGRSTAYMAVEILNSGKQIDFHCVDSWQKSDHLPGTANHRTDKGETAFSSFEENMKRGGVWSQIHPIKALSTEAATQFRDNSVDFVMIDAAHDYASVRDAVNAWLPKLKPGGLMAGDDADWPGVLIGVQEVLPASEIDLRNDGFNWTYRKIRPNRGHWITQPIPASPANHLAYIPFVNRPDLLHRAVQSIRELWPSLIIIDQSKEGLTQSESPWFDQIAGIFRAPFQSMTFSQMMNWAQAEAFHRECKHLIFMHNDAECRQPIVPQLLDDATRSPKAGVVFTNYDALAVFNVEALRQVGPWDETFHWYFADNDYYHRIKRAGWELREFGGDAVIHHVSQTKNADPEIAAVVNAEWRWHDVHYWHKWGGPPGQERYTLPYDGKTWKNDRPR